MYGCESMLVHKMLSSVLNFRRVLSDMVTSLEVKIKEAARRMITKRKGDLQRK